MTAHSPAPGAVSSPVVNRRVREYLELEDPSARRRPCPHLAHSEGDDRHLWLSVLGVLACLTLLLALVVL